MAIRLATGETRFEGLVLETGRQLGTFNDGYDWAIGATVWSPLAGEAVTVPYSSTMDLTPPEVTVDATPEVLALYAAWRARMERKAEVGHRLRRLERPERGARVKVVRGRKVPRGTEGVVFWTGPDRFGPGIRLGFRTDAGETCWTAGSNVEVMPTPEHEALRAEYAALTEVA